MVIDRQHFTVRNTPCANHVMMLAGDDDILKEKKPFCRQPVFDSFDSPSKTRPSLLVLFDIADDDPEDLPRVPVGVPSP